MKGIGKFLIIILAIALALGAMTYYINKPEGGIFGDSSTQEDTTQDASGSVGSDGGTSSTPTTVTVYLPNGNSVTKTSTAKEPAISSMYSSGITNILFCNEVISSYAGSILGLSVTNDGDVVESEGDILVGTGRVLAAGGNYVFYVIAQSTSEGGDSTEEDVCPACSSSDFENNYCGNCETSFYMCVNGHGYYSEGDGCCLVCSDTTEIDAVRVPSCEVCGSKLVVCEGCGDYYCKPCCAVHC